MGYKRLDDKPLCVLFVHPLERPHGGTVIEMPISHEYFPLAYSKEFLDGLIDGENMKNV